MVGVEVYLVNKKADMGIGVLIIFIAMILVAAIAAGVLVQTATSLQNKALLSGDRTRQQVSTGFAPLILYAENGSTNNNIETFYLKMKLIPGSDGIKLNDTLLEIDLQNQSADLNFNQSDGTCDSFTHATSASGDGNYSVKYLIRGPNFVNGYLQRGDVLMLCFNTPRSVETDEDVSFRLIPKTGTSLILETSVPDIVSQERVYLFP